jgi:RNA polymerase sigma-70 factor (ECF subfamily)
MSEAVENTIAAAMSDGLVRTSPECAPSALEAEVLDLFDRLRERLLGYLLRFSALSTEDAEDVVQEAFLALYQHLQRGRSRENLPGWLFRVVHNLGLRRAQGSRRDALRTVLLAEATEEAAVDAALDPESAAAQGQTTRRLEAVVQALPEQDQRCLMLRAEGLRYREIAKVLDMSLGAVAKSLERSLARMLRAAGR